MSRYRIGILGGGQLARMSVMAAQRMGISVVSLDEDADSPAAQVGPAHQGSIHEAKDIAEVMKRCGWITFENEFIKANTLRKACELADFDPKHVVPGIETLETIQDKLLQRRAYLNSGVPSPNAVDASEANKLGFPCVLKARYGGYDGKGTRYAKTESEYTDLEETWQPDGWLAEEFVSFRRELAVMVVATQQGEYFTFPTVVTEQKNHVCDLVYPCDSPEVATKASGVAVAAVKSLNGIGLFGVELFEHQDGSVSVNEIAPRPHNTGHYTLDWAGTSQFEAHILSVLGEFSGIHQGIPTCMANVLGIEDSTSYDKALAKMTTLHPEARMHWYGKRVSKAGRKMGHINVSGNGDLPSLAAAARQTFLKGWSKE